MDLMNHRIDCMLHGFENQPSEEYWHSLLHTGKSDVHVYEKTVS